MLPQLDKTEEAPKLITSHKPFWQRGPFLFSFVIIISLIVGAIGGLFGSIYLPELFGLQYPSYTSFHSPSHTGITTVPPTKGEGLTQEQAVISAVKRISPAVVSIIISKNLPVFEKEYVNPFPDFPEFKEFFGPQLEIPQYKQKGTKKQEIGGGSGFIISSDGMILTNKHVVSDKDAEYTVLANDGKRYPAKVLARDPVQDLAIIKIEKRQSIGKDGKLKAGLFPTVKIGDSSKLVPGQTVIAIGNALGEFRNTVSVGVISGLGRRITASGGGMVETLEDVIQTDAAINRGNSGGPLLNLKGEVIGINVAMAQGAQSIGFAIPINKAQRDIKQIKTQGKIVYPFLGVRYIVITKEIQKENNLSIDYGALIVRGNSPSEMAVIPGSPADKAGLCENDIILEVNGEKITTKNSLVKIIQKYNPGDKVTLKVMSRGKEKEVEVTLGERSE
ncbi:trypsin-like peptidase domain-containing protein [bacterium]|nr:trypsin-like peptidase domain-containing protein [bacterium]